MRAEMGLDGRIYCPECGEVMMTTYQERILWCDNKECVNHRKRFNAPKVELEPIPNEEITYANQGRDNEINERKYPSFE